MGSLPPGLTAPLITSAIAAPPCSPGSQAMSTAAAASCTAGEPIGRPATSTRTTRRAGRGDGRHEFLLDAGQVERSHVAALAGRAVVGQAGAIAHHQDGDVAPAAAATASSKPDRSAPEIVHPST